MRLNAKLNYLLGMLIMGLLAAPSSAADCISLTAPQPDPLEPVTEFVYCLFLTDPSLPYCAEQATKDITSCLDHDGTTIVSMADDGGR